MEGKRAQLSQCRLPCPRDAAFGGDLPSEESCKVLRFLCRSDLPLGVKFIVKETSSSPLKCECMPPAHGPGP